MGDSIALTEAVYYILLSLQAPLHGYGIMQKVAQLSGGRVQLAAGTLYGALGSLCEKGWIAALPGEGSRGKREYRLTAAGRQAAESELRRLHELAENGDRILGGTAPAEEAEGGKEGDIHAENRL